MADTTSSNPMPRAASLRGSISMRTAYLAGPKTLTWATPLTIETRCATVESAYSLTVESGRVSDLNTRNMTGKSPGFTLKYDGGAGIWGGSWRADLAIIDCTSWAAASMSRLRSNWRLTLVAPCVLVEFI